MKFIRYFLTTLIVLTIFIVSGAIFLSFLGFGLFGLSRILIYLQLADFVYNKGFYDNLIYYGSYIVFVYFMLFAIENLINYFCQKLYHSRYYQGLKYNLITFIVTTMLFYFVVHIHYSYINIDFWVLVVIIGILFICKEVFYPDSEDLNSKK